MATRPESSAGRAVRFVGSLDGSASPPQGLPVPHRMSNTVRVVVAVGFALGSALGLWAIVILWTAETPGWWFSALFTVFIGGLLVAVWAAYAGAIGSASEERVAADAWRAHLPTVRAETGTLVERAVTLGEEGDVLAFEIVIATEAGTAVTARWAPGNGIRRLLQPQVPGIGSPVIVWRADADSLAVVDVTDPTRVGIR